MDGAIWPQGRGSWLMAAPEFDKGTLARTLIGPCGQVTGLPDRRQAYGAAYLATLGPSAGFSRPVSCRAGPAGRCPYLYSQADIAALLAQARRLKTPLRQERSRC